MKIGKQVVLTEYVEIDINPEEVIEAMNESPDRMATLLLGLTRFSNFLKAVPGDMIEELNPKQRELVKNFLVEQSKRY